MAKPEKAETGATAAAASPLAEESLFEPDQAADNAGKNRALAMLLGGPWLGLAIVRVERIEIADRGWRVVYRK